MNKGGKYILTLKQIIQDGIWKAVNSVLPQEIANAPYNCTKYGKIIANLGNDKYTVHINDNELAIPAISGDSYSINDTVIVCIPNNNEQKQFILGKVKY
jgi:hypothetical protein